MTDWIKHDGGPQPVADDVWVEINSNLGALRGLAEWFPLSWEERGRYRILNQHLIDAVLKRGIELGLEAAGRAVCGQEIKAATKTGEYHGPGRFAGLAEATDLIRALDPETIAREAADKETAR